MGWLILIGLMALSLGGLRLLRVRGAALTASAAALLLGGAGYALQGSPGLPGAPAEMTEAGDVFPYPANPNAADVTAVMTPAMESVMSFEAEPSSLAKANDDVNKILAVNT